MIFWLNGMAGTGKSTIALTIASEYHQKGKLGGSYFFVRGGVSASAKGFFTTIAADLSRNSNSPSLQKNIIQAATNNTEVNNKTLREQWESLIL